MNELKEILQELRDLDYNYKNAKKNGIKVD